MSIQNVFFVKNIENVFLGWFPHNLLLTQIKVVKYTKENFFVVYTWNSNVNEIEYINTNNGYGILL